MDPLITLNIGICMSLLFGLGAAHKIRAPAVFRSAIDDYRLVPRSVSGVVAVCLVTAELLSALLVLFPATRITGLTAMGGLLIIYTAGISINLYRGRRDMDCGCGGPASKHPISGWLVLRNLLLLSLVLTARLPSANRPLNWLDLLVLSFGVLIAGGLYLGVNQLLAQAPRMARLRSSA